MTLNSTQRISLRVGLLLSLMTAFWLGGEALTVQDYNTTPVAVQDPEQGTSPMPEPIDAGEDTISELTNAEAIDGTAIGLDRLPTGGLSTLLQVKRTSFEQMVEERRIRVLVTYNQTNFFLDRGRARGLVAEALEQFENYLNDQLKLGTPRLDLIPIPVNRDQLITHLAEGRGDLAAGSITITPEREAIVDFSAPTSKTVAEWVVGGPSSPRLDSLDDLSGQTVMVRRSSSFFANLLRLNESFEQAGRAPIEIVFAEESLETEDLLEMVHAGLVPFTIADDYLARFWQQVLTGLVINPKLAIATGQRLGWAVRKDADGTLEWLNRFVGENRQGKLLGNMLINRYLKSTQFINNAASEEARERFNQVVLLFKIYGDQYGFDKLLLMAQGYQESGLDQSVRSPVGAIGIMQLMPSTAADKAVGIPDISTAENNIHAGARYLRHLRKVYFNDPELDDLNAMLFCFAAYNAGPNRIRRLRNKARDLGLDANQWFGNVEQVVADEVGREPVRYVRNIVKYYTAYKFSEARRVVNKAVDVPAPG